MTITSIEKLLGQLKDGNYMGKFITDCPVTKYVLT